MLVPACDRCPRQNVQLVTVLGVEICNLCVAETRAFLATSPIRSMTPFEQAARVCAAQGRVSAAELAAVNGEPRRRAYHRLIGMVRTGKLVHQGRGVFVLPEREAAE